MGKANFGGIVKQVCLEYTPEVEMGDYVLVHVGFALSKVDEAEAARTYQALERMQQLTSWTFRMCRRWPATSDPISANGKHPPDRNDRTNEPSLPESHEISRRISRRSAGQKNRRGNSPHRDEAVGADGSLRRPDSLDREVRHRSACLPNEVELVHGPGCPVCVTSLEMIDKALAIARRPDVIFCSFGDMLRVPGSKDDLLILKSRGADVRVVYSPIDCLKIARANPDKKVVFFAIGFETTAPANAMAVWQARRARDQEFFHARFACPRAAGDCLHSAIAAQSGAGISRTGPCLHRDGLSRIRADRGAFPGADRHHRVSSRSIFWKAR